MKQWKCTGSYSDDPACGTYDLWQSQTDEHTQIQVGTANGKEYVCARYTNSCTSRPLPGMPDEIAWAYGMSAKQQCFGSILDILVLADQAISTAHSMLIDKSPDKAEDMDGVPDYVRATAKSLGRLADDLQTTAEELDSLEGQQAL